MKRFTHAWIAIRATDRLEEICKQIVATKPEESEVIGYFAALLKDKINLVVEGSWLPDNVIGDFSDGHIWKYEPPLLPGKDWIYNRGTTDFKGYMVPAVNPDRFYLAHHNEILSLSYQEAMNVKYRFDKPWKKVDGYLVYRTIAVEQMMRDMILFQRDEMHRLAATLIWKYKDQLLVEKEEVTRFLASIEDVKKFYDEKEDGVYVNRAPIIKIRNTIDSAENKPKVTACLKQYGDQIKKHISDFNSTRAIQNAQVFFPMFYSDDQIALTFFTLSHYLSDAHMPLHCDDRKFGKSSGHIHKKIEEKWEWWVIDEDESDKLVQSLSESERAKNFLKLVYPEEEYNWKKYKYPAESVLEKLENRLGDDLWVQREARLYDTKEWENLTGITYASYCIASRLIEFSDKKRVVPENYKDLYTKNFDCANVVGIKGVQWEDHVDGVGLDPGFGNMGSSNKNKVRTLRKSIYDFLNDEYGVVDAFKYLSLIVLVDSVECVAKMWAKTIIDHLEIAYRNKDSTNIP